MIAGLEKAFIDINKRFGEGSIFKLGDGQCIEIDRFSSGSIALDAALGGGYPRGRMTEIYGAESSGKSTLCLHAIAEIQKAGGNCAYIDGEHGLEPEYARSIGVDLSQLLVSQPEYLEQALEILEALIKGGVDLIIFDSTSSMPPRAELEGDYGDSHMGLAARLMSQACRKINPLLKQYKCAVMWVSQTRQKIGVSTWGDNTAVGVGNALKFYASARVKIARTGSNKQMGESVSNKTKVIVKKNKTAPPFKEAEFDIVFGIGIDWQGELVDLAVAQEIISKRGSWFEFTNTETGEIIKRQGKPNFQADLSDSDYNLLKKLLAEGNSKNKK